MQDAADEAAAAVAARHRAVRKSEAHQRLKECNRQRRSLAGAVASCLKTVGNTHVTDLCHDAHCTAALVLWTAVCLLVVHLDKQLTTVLGFGKPSECV